MTEQMDVRILAWPESPVNLRHSGDEQPVRLLIAVEPDPPVQVELRTDEPLDVRMQMDIAAQEPVALCIDVCEPICASSDYQVGMDLFDQPVAQVAVRGTTRVERCATRSEPVEVCQRFDEVTTGEGSVAVRAGDVRLRAIGGTLHATSDGPPEGATTVLFPDTGIRIELPGLSHGVRLTARNFGSELTVRVLGDGGRRTELAAGLHNEVGNIVLSGDGIKAVELRGGSNEAGVVEVCFTPDRFL
jgi:hypothetical protein